MSCTEKTYCCYFGERILGRRVLCLFVRHWLILKDSQANCPKLLTAARQFSFSSGLKALVLPQSHCSSQQLVDPALDFPTCNRAKPRSPNAKLNANLPYDFISSLPLLFCYAWRSLIRRKLENPRHFRTGPMNSKEQLPAQVPAIPFCLILMRVL